MRFQPGATIVHRASGQKMIVERRVCSFFSTGVGKDAYWCTWSSIGIKRRGLYSEDELELARPGVSSSASAD